MNKRRGPRPRDDTRALILDAALRHFSDEGYPRASIRAIARDAGVDPALVRHYFPSRGDLYAAALAGNLADPGWLLKQVADGPVSEIGERTTRCFLEAWEDPHSRVRLVALFRSSCDEAGLEVSREHLITHAFTALTDHLGVDRPELRGELAAALLSGTAAHRHLMRDTVVWATGIDEVIATVAPLIQRLLVDPLPTAAAARAA